MKSVLKNEDITYGVIGAAMEVHRELGPGFLEGVYQEALQIEFQLREIKFSAQDELAVNYKGNQLRIKYKPDFVVAGRVVVEIKALPNITGVEVAQLLNYLKASGIDTGILINYGSQSLEWKTMVL